MKSKKAAVEIIPFNFKSIKDIAKPGSWRRGYGYYRTPGQVMSVELNKTGIFGRVKGNFKDAYEVQLDIKEDHVSANCECPVEEEWCKHAVAVGLTAIRNHL